MYYQQGSASATPAVFTDCYNNHGGEMNSVLQCVTAAMEAEQARAAASLTSFLLVLCGALVFSMQLGFAMVCAGCVRRKNVGNTLLKNVLDAAGAAVAFFALGYALAYGGEDPTHGLTFCGNQGFFLTGPSIDYAFFFYQYTFSAAAVTVIAGVLAERCRMSAYLSYSVWMTGFVYPIIVHSLWSANGFLSPFANTPFLGIGAIDFAGSGVVHMSGGATALIATWILGARKGRFTNSSGERLEKPKAIAGHSVSLQVMGTLLLWFGWYGFNSGAALLLPGELDRGDIAALTAVNTSLAGSTAAISAMVTYLVVSGKHTGELAFDLNKTLNGGLTGLVAITAGCGVFEPWAAALTGVIAGWLYLLTSNLLVKWRLDDAVDGIPVHMFGGMWGLFSVGLFASTGRMEAAYGTTDFVGLFYAVGDPSTPVNANLLSAQVVAILFIFGWITALMLPFFKLLNHINWLRTDTVEEIAGLDAAYQVSTEEDQDQIKKKIREEFQKHKNERNRASMDAGTRRSTASGHSRVSSVLSSIEDV